MMIMMMMRRRRGKKRKRRRREGEGRKRITLMTTPMVMTIRTIMMIMPRTTTIVNASEFVDGLGHD